MSSESGAGAGTIGLAVFRQLLVNTLVSGVTSSFVWFALTFWVYLETSSVTAIGVIGGAFGISTALLGPVFGTYVDRHTKHQAMVLSSLLCAACFVAATLLFLAVDADAVLRMTGPWFWLMVALTLVGSVAGQLRSIALSTCVTLLVPEDRRDRANGMVGTVTGISFAVTSVFSGLVIGRLGMGWALYLSVALTLIAVVHLLTISIPGDEAAPPAEGESTSHVDVRGAIDAIKASPGLTMVIALGAFNNLLAGVFMALIDPYGLELVSVQTWGFLWGLISMMIILGGVVVAKVGLGRAPVRVVVYGNLVNWICCSLFTIQPSIVLLTAGLCVWLLLVPAIEAAEQTVLQRAVPFEKQGRVFGFAQLVENAASPVTSIFVGPVAAAVFVPFMTTGRGADWIGSWFGTGRDRGMALVFTLAGLVGIVVTLLTLGTRSYRRLVADEVAAVEVDPEPEPALAP